MEAENRKLFVGNISWDTTEDGLREAFGKYGTVEEAQIITHRDTGRSKGFAFVTMASADEAQAAIDGLNGTEIDGREVTVNVARPREERDNGGYRG